MITPKLEELILCGRAFFKTAVVGGSKTTINIDNDRFIIITDITYLPYFDVQIAPQDFNSHANMQLNIYGEKGFNHYIFANQRPSSYYYFDGTSDLSTYVKNAREPQKIDCYLLHTTQVGFSFILNPTNLPVTALGVAPAPNPGFAPPLDYGKDGDPGAINIDTAIIPFPTFTNAIIDRVGGIGIGTDITQQIQYPALVASKPQVDNNHFFPIANINYIEVLGQPNNIGF